MAKQNYYSNHIGDLKRRLVDSVGRDELRELHQVRPLRHFLVLLRHLALALGCGVLLWQSDRPWLWIPAGILQGCNLLGFVILLHEQVHECIFRNKRPRLQKFLGRLYAFPVGMSATQFKLWHLAHHDELGSHDDDPKRAHLSPKKNSRWVKFLYATPALFFIYSRASRQEAASYPAETRRVIQLERLVSIIGLLSILGVMIWLGGVWPALRVWALPLLITFPPAFTLNRLGQHYNVDPTNPAKWSSRVDGNPFWWTVFLWSNFHMEHHYYPRVPFYNLTRLNRKLRPFFNKEEIPNRTYREIVWGWIGRNQKAHTNWDQG